jgi:hypothetical protein
MFKSPRYGEILGNYYLSFMIKASFNGFAPIWLLLKRPPIPFTKLINYPLLFFLYIICYKFGDLKNIILNFDS